MIDEQELRELAGFQVETPILSVYVDTDPTQRTNEEVLLSLRHMLEAVERETTPEDVVAIQRYFEHEYDWTGRGVILFSCAAADFWRAYTLALPVASGATVARRPYLSPLAALMDAYGRFAVASVDRQGLHLYLFQLGELIQEELFEGEEVRKLKKGRGSSAGPGRRGGAPVSSRHEEETALRNLREAAKIAERFYRRYSPAQLLLAGTDSTVAQFRDLLPKEILERVIGTVVVDAATTVPEILDRSLDILDQVDRRREAALVDQVFTAAAKGREGAVGLEETLNLVREGRVRTLIVDRHFHAPGYRCSKCGYLTAHASAQCPFCAGSLVEIPDAAEAVVTQVIEEGGEVEVVDDNPQLAAAGIGALLRY